MYLIEKYMVRKNALLGMLEKSLVNEDEFIGSVKISAEHRFSILQIKDLWYVTLYGIEVTAN